MMIEDELTKSIIGGAIDVHKHWGPGLYEEIYEKSLCRELELRGHRYERQLHLPLVYKEAKVGEDLKLDVWVERKVIVENKHVKELLPIHEAQLLTYMKITGTKVGLLINYREKALKDGIRRLVL